jgi:hypothetical protein
MSIIIPTLIVLSTNSIVPTTGSLSLAGLGKEKVYNSYTSGSAITDVELGDMTKGIGYDSTNTNRNPNPGSTAPCPMSDWHGYDHDYSANDPNTTHYYTSNFVYAEYRQGSGNWGSGWSSSNLGHTNQPNTSNGTYQTHTIGNVRFYIANFPYGYGSGFSSGVSLTITISQWGTSWSDGYGQHSQWVSSFSKTITPSATVGQATSYNATKHVLVCCQEELNFE